MTILASALEQSLRSFNFSFDEQIYAIRRNLMVVSSILIGLTFIKAPEGGNFEINIGIIKGVIEKPHFVYIFAAIVCLYYLLWFYAHCRGLIVKNYSSIKNAFLHRLAALRATDEYHRFRDDIPENLPANVNFRTTGGGGSRYLCESQLIDPLQDIKPYALGIEKLAKSKAFSIKGNPKSQIVYYEHKSIPEDLYFLQKNMDFYWRSTISAAFVTILPISYASLALVAMSIHLYNFQAK